MDILGTNEIVYAPNGHFAKCEHWMLNKAVYDFAALKQRVILDAFRSGR
jgi:hypothetical protein